MTQVVEFKPMAVKIADRIGNRAIQIITQQVAYCEMKKEKALSHIQANLVLACGVCAIEARDEVTLNVISKAVLERFGEFREKEILGAFKLAASGKIDFDESHFWKPLNLILVNEVLGGYKKMRTKWLSDYKAECLRNQPRQVGKCDDETKEKLRQFYRKQEVEDEARRVANKKNRWRKTELNTDKINEAKELMKKGLLK